MKTTTANVANIYPILDKAKYSKMDNADRKALIKAMRPMKKVAEEYNDFREGAVKRLRPENFDKVAELIDRFNSLSQEERKAAIADPEYQEAFKVNGEYNNAINDCLKDEFDKEIELDFTPLTEDAVDRLLDSNTDWTLGLAMAVEELLCSNED